MSYCSQCSIDNAWIGKLANLQTMVKFTLFSSLLIIFAIYIRSTLLYFYCRSNAIPPHFDSSKVCIYTAATESVRVVRMNVHCTYVAGKVTTECNNCSIFS